MENLMRRAAGNISSKFGMLQAHTSLVLTISEENQVYEVMLKLILARVNSATSLLKWARGEENPSLQMAVQKLYDVMLIWANVQKQFAEQYHLFSKALKEILDIECGIDAIRKEYREAEEKLDKLKKQGDSVRIVKRNESNKFMSFQEELKRAEDNVIELSSELQLKSIKSEIFKATRMRSALCDVTSDCVTMADNTKTVFQAARQIVEQIPDMPPHLANNQTGAVSDSNVEDGILDGLAADLCIDRPRKAQPQKQQSIFHVGLPQRSIDSASNKVMLKIQSSSPPKPAPYAETANAGSTPVLTVQHANTSVSVKATRVQTDSRAPQPLPRRRTTKDKKKEMPREKLLSDASDYKSKTGSCKPPPLEPPPPLPTYRSRSKSSSMNDLCIFYEEPPLWKKAEFQPEEYEGCEYVQPNVSPENLKRNSLTRSTSEASFETNVELKRSPNQDIYAKSDYCDPLDSYAFAWSASPPHSYEDDEDHYNEPFDAVLGTTRHKLAPSQRYPGLVKQLSSSELKLADPPQFRRHITTSSSSIGSVPNSPSSPKSPRAGDGKNVKEMVALLHDKVKLSVTSNCHVTSSVLNV